MVLGRRHQTSDAQFWEALELSEQLVSREQLEELSAQTIAHIRAVTKGKKTAFAWSGGKDSLVLAHLLQRAGVPTTGMLGITQGLEYPMMDGWYEQYAPEGIEIIRAPYDLAWLAKRQELIFTLSPPHPAHLTGFWAEKVWQQPQQKYCEKYGKDLLILGRRRADGNYCGPKESPGLYKTKGVLRYLPIMHWTQEQTIAYLSYYELTLPPIYYCIHGFKVGTHPWPARQSILDEEDGWAQVYSCDPHLVYRLADAGILGAQKYLKNPVGIKSRNLHVWAGRVLGSAL